MVILSDVHIGSAYHDEKAFDACLAWCRRHDAMIYLNGDIIENSIITGGSPGEKLLDQSINPTQQVLLAAHKLVPFAKRGRIAGSTRGNHESRTRREGLLDLCEIMAALLGVEYHEIGGYVRVDHGSQRYLGWIQHGRSSASNIWLELRRWMDRAPLAEFVAAGHNHALEARQVPHITITSDGLEGRSFVWQIRTGNFLGYADYLRDCGISPGASGCPVLRFSDREHRIDVDTRTLSWLR